MASAVYIFNDIVDGESDRPHPTKRNRPIASGAGSMTAARVICVALVIANLVLAASVSRAALALVACYAAMNVACSFGLKHVVVGGVFVIAAGFVLRVLIGTLGVGIPPSAWLMLWGMMLTLLLGFGRRRAELKLVASDGTMARKVLAQYDLPLVEQFLAITGACGSSLTRFAR